MQSLRISTPSLIIGALCVFVECEGATAGPPAGDDLRQIALKNAPAAYREYLEFLALPSDAIVPADIEKNVVWLIRALQRAGLQAKRLENGGRPMVYAEWPNRRAELKTVLLYMHFDAQPVVPQSWHQPNPWVPVLKERAADGSWKVLQTDLLFRESVNPDWRVFARTAADDKGPIAMFLAAADAMHRASVDPRTNLKVILDSEEEKGSPGLSSVIDANRALLAADGLLVVDGPMHPSNRPTVIFGNRGLAALTLTVYGAKRALHSGHYGNYAPNPAFMLAQLLASMKDARGKVVIPGYYDGVTIDDRARKVMSAVPDDEDGLKKELGFAKPDGVGATLQEALQYPSLNVRGLKSAEVGDKVATIVPDTAIAEIDIRTVPEVDANRLIGLVRAWIEKQGFHVTSGPPTDQERAANPRLASMVARVGDDAVAARTDLEAAIGTWTQRAIRRAFGAEPVRIRIMGGTVPTAAMARKLDIPFVIVPLANYDNNQHTHDENLRLGNFRTGVETFLALLTEPLSPEPGRSKPPAQRP